MKKFSIKVKAVKEPDGQVIRYESGKQGHSALDALQNLLNDDAFWFSMSGDFDHVGIDLQVIATPDPLWIAHYQTELKEYTPKPDDVE